MTRNDLQTLANLLNKGDDVTEQERSLRDELLEQQRSESTPEQEEKLLRAASLLAGTALSELSRAKLRMCSLTEPQIDLFDDVRGRLFNNESITPEQKHEFDIVCGLILRCWGIGGGGGDPPDGNDGPDFGRSIADLIAAAHADDDEKAKPSPVVPPQEPAPMQPDLRPKVDEERKGKRRPRRMPRKDGWEIG
jgi:hypothetical protein